MCLIGLHTLSIVNGVREVCISLTDELNKSWGDGQYAAGISFIATHPRFKEAVEAAFKFCGGGEGELPDEATLSRSMRVLIPPISDDQVFLSLAFLP